jgi:hypothetical protein
MESSTGLKPYHNCFVGYLNGSVYIKYLSVNAGLDHGDDTWAACRTLDEYINNEIEFNKYLDSHKSLCEIWNIDVLGQYICSIGSNDSYVIDRTNEFLRLYFKRFGEQHVQIQIDQIFLSMMSVGHMNKMIHLVSRRGINIYKNRLRLDIYEVSQLTTDYVNGL